jgi:hypothetical protein
MAVIPIRAMAAGAEGSRFQIEQRKPYIKQRIRKDSDMC